jgi:hypothetical protein
MYSVVYRTLRRISHVTSSCKVVFYFETFREVFFFSGSLIILEDDVATSAAIFANMAQKLDDGDLAVVFNNIGGLVHGDNTEAVGVHRMSPLFSFFLSSYA